MEDRQIVALYRARSENAISETAKKYGRYCLKIAMNILHSHEDSEECVNDTYLRAWNVIPPQNPKKLSAFLGRITRNLALDCYASRTAQKRGGGQLPLALEELQECIPASESTEHAVTEAQLTEALNRFLSALSPQTRQIFVQRYWYFNSIREIASALSLGESKVKMTLLRTRNELKAFLEKEGIEL